MKHYYFWTLFILGFAIEIFSILPFQSSNEIGVSGSSDFVKGIIHVHSNFSDGGSSPDRIAEAANQAGLDFVVLTDHNTQDARKQGFEKKYGNTDFFVEMEASTSAGHTINFFSQNETLRESGNQTIAQASYRQILETQSYPNMFVSIAHPSNIKNPWSRLDHFAEGFEVVNFDSSWQRQLSDSPLRFFLTALIYPFNEYLSALRFLEIYPKDFNVWDEMTSRGPGHFAYLAHDTHSKVKLNNQYSLAWPDYLMTFKLASNILFLKEPKAADFEKRKQQYYLSLKEGRSAIVYQSVFPFNGNSWNIQCGEKKWGPGDVVRDVTGCEAWVQTPITPFIKVIRLVKNGEQTHEVLVDKSSKEPLRLPLSGAGTYRVEVWAKLHSALRLALNRPVPYIFYNPIYLQ